MQQDQASGDDWAQSGSALRLAHPCNPKGEGMILNGYSLVTVADEIYDEY